MLRTIINTEKMNYAENCTVVRYHGTVQLYGTGILHFRICKNRIEPYGSSSLTLVV